MTFNRYKTSRRDAAQLRIIEAKRLKSIKYGTVQMQRQFNQVKKRVSDHIIENISQYNEPTAAVALLDPNDPIYNRIRIAANDPEGIANVLVKIWLHSGKTFIELTSESLKSYNRFGIVKKSAKSSTFTKSIDFSFWTSLVNAYVTTLFVRKITAINETSRLAIVKFISGGIADGLSIQNIAKEIMTGKIPGLNRQRAIMIARTEVIASSNAASLETAKSTGVKGLKKKWLVTNDGRERLAHSEAGARYNDNPIPLESPFIVDGEMLMYPGYPTGSAGNVINCRCAVAYVTRRFG